MNATIIAVGSEMLGPTRLDTNSLKITGALEEYGVTVTRKSVVGDTLDALVREIEFALDGAELLVLTGGLGPTSDDLTREALARAFGLTMEIDESIVARIEARFAARGWKMPEVNRRQASVFPGHRTLDNERGTAPGFHLQVGSRDVWVFPGVPHELEWMLETYFRPWLESASGGARHYRRVLKIAGMSESGVEERLAPYYAAHRDEPLTILASGGHIELHLMETSPAEVERRERELRAMFEDRVFGADDDTIEGVVGSLLAERAQTVATAESCTGGLLGSRITDVPGSSRYFVAGVICYDAAAKVALARVDPELIRAHGEVSPEVAIALAEGIRKRFETTFGVGITGIAGPGGGSESKPVGTVHIAVADGKSSQHRKLFWPASRSLVKWYSTQAALDLLRLSILRR